MKIDTYSFGTIVIDGKRYSKDVIIYPGRVFSPWWRKEGHLLQLDDLSEVITEKPDVLIDELGALGIDVRPEKTTKAVTVFNSLSGKKVVAALHLTC
jgi:hypothetical protein